MTEEKLYYVLRWNKVVQSGFPRYEVRPMPVELACDYTIVASGITFETADNRRRFLEEEDNA